MRLILARPIVFVFFTGSVLLGVFWWRSYSYGDGVSVVWRNGNQLWVGSGFGVVGMRFFRLQYGLSLRCIESARARTSAYGDGRPMRGDRHASFSFSRTAPAPVPQGGFTQITYVGVPYWGMFVFLQVVLAVCLIRQWRRDRRVPATACPDCSYDLTANVSGVCPECGTAIPESVRQRLAAEQSLVDFTTKSDLQS